MKVACGAIARQLAELDQAEADLKDQRRRIAERRESLKQAQAEFENLSPALQAIFAASTNGHAPAAGRRKKRSHGEPWRLLKHQFLAGGNEWRTARELAEATGVDICYTHNLLKRNLTALEVLKGERQRSAKRYRLKPAVYAKLKGAS